MKILIIAPLPPPIHGQSLATQILVDYLKKNNDLEVVDTNKASHKEGFSGFGRVIDILHIYLQILKKKSTADIIYFQISESLGGNLKDLLIYWLLYFKLSKSGRSVKMDWTVNRHGY